ncbi:MULTISPECIES: HPP family protein [Alteromonadaceae]|uniref:HPP family protein n=1 Tax=Alteromonadaceae TaxID=72275 RepID=UPI001C0889E2|nr:MULTISPECIES: HPP family protein [Aliiglaciecola]MBU2880225.1 hypothetical protein [Aliiglaciecola lipolytica]MDO6713238.1 HPP family protein [Aliiglaciecola sp. 2_MG-2023]MDO6754324.1 HPP family protein [Aliiglaciecola sp. 1_MG-2023]
MNLKMNEEHHPGKVVGVFEDESTAKKTAEILITKGGVSSDEVAVVSPKDKQFAKKIEPETKQIGRTLLASHIMLGLIGLVIGLLVASSLIISGIQFAVSSPIMLMIATGTLGTFMGLLVAGAASLRPDHDSVVNEVRQGRKNNQWSVVVQTKDKKDIQRAKQLMKGSAVKLAETF